MRILLAILCPPVAVLMCGKWFQGLFISPILTACLWVPGMIHALVVVSNWGKVQREHEALIAAAKSTIMVNARKAATAK